MALTDGIALLWRSTAPEGQQLCQQLAPFLLGVRVVLDRPDERVEEVGSQVSVGQGCAQIPHDTRRFLAFQLAVDVRIMRPQFELNPAGRFQDARIRPCPISLSHPFSPAHRARAGVLPALHFVGELQQRRHGVPRQRPEHAQSIRCAIAITFVYNSVLFSGLECPNEYAHDLRGPVAGYACQRKGGQQL
jgi:hypothetical protein